MFSRVLMELHLRRREMPGWTCPCSTSYAAYLEPLTLVPNLATPFPPPPSSKMGNILGLDHPLRPSTPLVAPRLALSRSLSISRQYIAIPPPNLSSSMLETLPPIPLSEFRGNSFPISGAQRASMVLSSAKGDWAAREGLRC